MIQGLIAKTLWRSIKIVFLHCTASSQLVDPLLMYHMDSIEHLQTGHQFSSHSARCYYPPWHQYQTLSPPRNKQTWHNLGYGGHIGIAAFGRVRHSKGIDVLVEAATQALPKHPQVVVLIGGETQNKDLAFQHKLQQAINYRVRATYTIHW